VSEGILYAAIGRPYLEEAVRSARSSLRFNAVPHLICTDGTPEDPDGDLQVRRCPSSGNPYADKIQGMIDSPFERTLYLDTDTYVLAEIVELFALLDRFDLGVSQSPGYRGLADPEVPHAFYELNTGVVLFRSNPKTEAFLADWLSTYVRWCAEPPFQNAGNMTGYADQPAFRNCAWHHDVDICVLGHEYCYRTPQCGQVADRVRVIHGRHDDYERVAEILNREQRARVFPRGTFLGL
jgi:hypothetical protein